MPNDAFAMSQKLAQEATARSGACSYRLHYDTAIDWILRASNVHEVLPNGPHAQHWHTYWVAYLDWTNEEGIDLGEAMREKLAHALHGFLDHSLKGLREPFWQKNTIVDKGLHILNVTCIFETYQGRTTPCDALHRILKDGRWNPAPLLDLLYATEDKQRESLRLTTNVTRRWTWNNHPYWLLMEQLSVQTALGILPLSALAGVNTSHMWRMAPVFELDHPARAVSNLAQAAPSSFHEALVFYKDQRHRMSPAVANAMFQMDLTSADPLLCMESIIALVADHPKNGASGEVIDWLKKTLPQLLQSMESSAQLGLLADDMSTQAAYWVPLWNKLVHGKDITTAILPEGWAGS